MRAFASGLAAGYGIAIPVGAIAVLILDTAARRGFPPGFAAGAGAATADLIYAAVAALVGLAAADAIEPLQTELQVVGGAVLLALAAYRIAGLARHPPAPSETRGSSGLPRTYGGFLGLTLVNPLTIIYFAALIAGLSGDLLSSTTAKVLFVAGAFLASLSWQTALAGAGALAGGRLSLRAQRATGLVGNLVVVGFAVRLFVEAVR